MKCAPHTSIVTIVVATLAWLALPMMQVQAGESDPEAAEDSSSSVELSIPFSAEHVDLGFTEPDEEQPRISRDVPWLTQDQLYYNSERSAYWNNFFRGGRGQITATAVQYVTYEYNNRDETNDEGVIREYHHMLHLSGTPYPGVRLIAGAGINTLQIDRGNNESSFLNYTGLTFDLGLEIGLSLGERFGLELGARYRQYQAERGMDSESYERAFAQWYRIQTLFTVEFLGDRTGVTWGMYAGASTNLVTQSWHFLEGRNKITPNNSGSLQNGPSRYDVIVGTNLALSEMINFNVEGRFIGPIMLNFSASFLV